MGAPPVADTATRATPAVVGVQSATDEVGFWRGAVAGVGERRSRSVGKENTGYPNRIVNPLSQLR